MPFKHSPLRHSPQDGLSLLELLVALIIGLLLLTALATTLISTKKSDKSRQAVSEMDANAQFTMDAIRQAVSHTGYPSIRTIHLEKAFYSKEDGNNLTNPNCRGGSQRDIDGFTPTQEKWTRDADLSDILTVVALADNPCKEGKSSCASASDTNKNALVYTDCADGGREKDERTVNCSTDVDVGMNDPTEAKIFNTFRLDTDEKTLICEGSRGGRVILADGIYAMQFLYGIRTSSGDTSYKNADSIESAKEWGLVKSVQVALLMESAEDRVFDTNSQSQYKLLDKTITIPTNQLRHAYRVYTMTISLPNMK